MDGTRQSQGSHAKLGKVAGDSEAAFLITREDISPLKFVVLRLHTQMGGCRMYLLGIAGLVGVESFLKQHFPAQMAMPSRIVQGLDAAAALICDGRVIAAASEERFDRRKKSGAFPIAAIDSCLNIAGIDMTDVEQVCGNFNFGRYRILYRNDIAKTYWQGCLSPDAITARLATHYTTLIDFHPIDHHDAHLHCALASADFENCLAIVMDAAGEIGATTVYRIEEGKVKRLRRYAVSQSLGMFYSLITQFLGFLFNEDEYKMLQFADTVDEAFDHIRAGLEKYHMEVDPFLQTY